MNLHNVKTMFAYANVYVTQNCLLVLKWPILVFSAKEEKSFINLTTEEQFSSKYLKHFKETYCSGDL